MAKEEEADCTFFCLYSILYITHEYTFIHFIIIAYVFLSLSIFCFFYTFRFFAVRLLSITEQQIAFNLPKKKQNVRRLPLNFTHLVSLVCTNSWSFNIMCYICYSRIKIIDKRSHSKMNWRSRENTHSSIRNVRRSTYILFHFVRARFVSILLSLSSMIFTFTSLPVYFNFLLVKI